MLKYTKPLRVMVLGLRGFPNVEGGVEKHCEHLYPILAGLGCDVEVLVRAQYMAGGQPESWKGVRFKRLWSPRRSGLEAFWHSFVGVLYAAFKRPDILHIQSIGPGLFTPLARIAGLRVVVTHHGPNYEHDKWGALSRFLLKLGERWSMNWSHGRIAISEYLQARLAKQYGKEIVVIGNGVERPEIPSTKAALERFDLVPGRYILLVGRLVAEKRHIDLIRAFAQAGPSGWKLVLVGSALHPDDYSRAVDSLIATTPDTVATGYQSGLALRELYAHAGVFVLPSASEGLPIALLEALSFGLPVIASDIPANLEVGLPAGSYFPMGDISVLAQRLAEFTGRVFDAQECAARREWVTQRYDWQEIAKRTLDLYCKILS